MDFTGCEGLGVWGRGYGYWGRARAHLLRGGGPGPGWSSVPVRGVWNSGLIGVAGVVTEGTALIAICFRTDCDTWCSDHSVAGGTS